MTTPPSPRAPVEQRHRELARKIVGFTPLRVYGADGRTAAPDTYTQNQDDIEDAAQLLADAEAQAVKKWEDSLREMYRKLDEGTLHVVYCNGDHSKRVGTEGYICNCTLGKEIKDLRRERNDARSQLSSLQEQLAAKDAKIQELEKKNSELVTLCNSAAESGHRAYETEKEIAAQKDAQLSAIQEQLRNANDALTFIADYGGKSVAGMKCTGTWCAEQANSVLGERSKSDPSIQERLAMAESRVQELEGVCYKEAEEIALATAPLTLKISSLQAQLDSAREEIEVVRQYGNRDCLAMADNELRLRQLDRRAARSGSPPGQKEGGE